MTDDWHASAVEDNIKSVLQKYKEDIEIYNQIDEGQEITIG